MGGSDLREKVLDVEMIQRLYEFGGLLAYEVEYFDTVTFKVVKLPMTFNEQHAIEQAEQYRANGFNVSMLSHMVKFDGAFSA